MPWQAARRATLLIPSGPNHDPSRNHLHIVLNDPYPDHTHLPKVLVVSVTGISNTNLYDPSCSLFPGEHPFVVKPSYVIYKFSKLMDPGVLDAKVRAKEYAGQAAGERKVICPYRDGVAGLAANRAAVTEVLRGSYKGYLPTRDRLRNRAPLP